MQSLTKVIVILFVTTAMSGKPLYYINYGHLSTLLSTRLHNEGKLYFPGSMANVDFLTWRSPWQSLKVKNGSCVTTLLGNRLQMDHPRQSTLPHNL